MSYLLYFICAISGLMCPTENIGATIFVVQQGGTGAGTHTVGNLLYGAGTDSIKSVSTTTLTASSPLSLSNPVAKVGGSNSVLTIDTSGAWSGTAGSLAANGANCSAGNAPLGVDQLGAVETCFDVWTEAENTAAGYSSLSGGSTNALTYWTSATAVSATASPTVGYITGTTTATSTLAGGIHALRLFTDTIEATSTTPSVFTVAPYFSNITSALTLTGSTGLIAEYAGAGCTNQVVEDISALGATTCVSIESEQLGDDDWGEGTITAGVFTIDDGVIESEHFGDDDWGEITIASNVATLDDSVTVTGWVMGDSTGNTPAADDNDTSLATTAFVQGEIAGFGSGSSKWATTTGAGLRPNGGLGTGIVLGNALATTTDALLSLYDNVVAFADGMIFASTTMGENTAVLKVFNPNVDDFVTTLFTSDTSTTFSLFSPTNISRHIELSAGGSETTILMQDAVTGDPTIVLNTDADSFFLNNNFGIGTSTPRFTGTLASSTAPQLALSSEVTDHPLVTLRNIGGNLYFSTTTTADNRATSTPASFVIRSTGTGVHIGTTSEPASANITGLSVIGTVLMDGLTTESGAGNVLCVKTNDLVVQDDSPLTACSGASSWKVKRNILDIDSKKSLDLVLALNPVSYFYKESWTTDRTQHLGFIAEEVEPLDPILVEESEVKGLKYIEFIPHIVGAIQEIWYKITGIESRLDALEKENAELKARIEALEK